jgi:signal transduction histidine kinase
VTQGDVESLATMRARIVGALSWGAALLGFIAYVPSVIASITGGRLWIAVADTVLYGWVVAVRAIPLSSPTRAKNLVAILFVIGAMLLFALGPYGYGPMWMVGAAIAAGALLGARPAALLIALQGAAILVTTIALVVVEPDWWIIGADVFAWLAFASGSLFLSGALSFPVARLLQGLEATADKRVRLEKELLNGRKLEAMGAVAGNIAHEFSNLLQPILALTGTALATTKQDDPLAADLREIFTAAERARDLVRQMLTYTRKSETPRRPWSLAQSVRDLSVLLRASVPALVRVEVVGDNSIDDVVEIAGSELQQILLNLVLNAAYALKAKPGGGVVKIEIGAFTGDVPAAAKDAGSGFVRLAVSDDGAGMDAATLEHLFEPFFTTKPAGEGTGLGLATVRGIVASLGGAIAVKSEPAKGTTFTIALPRAKSALG